MLLGLQDLPDWAAVPRDVDGIPVALNEARRKLDAYLGWPPSAATTGYPQILLGTGITGVGRTKHGWNAIEVLVRKEVPQVVVDALVPKWVDGWPVVVRRSGPIIAL